MTLTLLASAPIQLSSAQIAVTHHHLQPPTSTSFTFNNSLSNLNGKLSAASQHQPFPHPSATESTLDKHQQLIRPAATAVPHSQPQGPSTQSSLFLASSRRLQQAPQHQDPPSFISSPQSSSSPDLRELMTTPSTEAPTSMSATPANQPSTSSTCQQPSQTSSLPLLSSTVSVATAAATAVHTSATATSAPSSSPTAKPAFQSSSANPTKTTPSTRPSLDLSAASLQFPSSTSSSPSASPSELSLTASMPSETRAWMTQEITPATTPMSFHNLHHEGLVATAAAHKKRSSWSMSVDYHHNYPSRPTHSRQYSFDKSGQQQAQQQQHHTQDQERSHQQPSYTQTPTSNTASSQHTNDSSLPLGPTDVHPQQQQQQPHLSPKRRSISRRPWTNAEQEALYIAVEKHKLFGQWQEVGKRMKLDRTVHEIEDEYMRIYGELPDSEDGDEESLCSPTTTAIRHGGEGYSHQQQPHQSIPASSASSPSSARSSFSLASTPGGSGTSSTMSLMARHEQMFPPIQYESIFEQDEEEEDEHAAGGEMQVDYKGGVPPSGRLNHNDGGGVLSSSARQQNPHQHGHRGSISSSPTRMRRPSTHLPTHTKSASSLSGMSDQHPHPHAHHPHHHRAASESHSSSRPTRMVRVWTPEQSERLKNLIELYFPGAYRINWVWVAEQMGNSFTRKQCKNKWEIMRRRMGTEEEIVLLKKGYEEFGPSWGEIQEKYLPERSRGGIEIMWELLESREAGQNQPPPPPPQLLPTVTQLKQSALPVDDQCHVPQHLNHGHQSSTATSAVAGGSGTATTPPNRKQRTSGLSIATSSISQHPLSAQGSSPPPSSSSKSHPSHYNTANNHNGYSNTTPLTSLSAGGLATSDIEAMEISSPPLTLVSPRVSISGPASSLMMATATTAATAAGAVHDRDGNRLHAGRDSWHRREPEEPAVSGDVGDDEAYGSSAWRQHERTATGSSSVGMSIDSSGSGSGSPLMHPLHQRQQQHGHIPEENVYYVQDPAAGGATLNTNNNGHSSTDRSAPMIWTEPLTRRLEQAIQEHFPNGEKVNWAKISTLMGNHPAVSRDQCKRRWYLISQNQFYQRRHHEMQAAAGAAAGTPQPQQALQVAGGGAGSPPSMTMMEMETTEREMQQQQQPMRPYYGQQGQYLHHQHQNHSHPPQQHSPRDGWSE